MSKVTVIDFETANAKRNSACAIGIVVLEKDKIVEQKDFLIKPVGEYNWRNTQVHGLTYDDTIYSPTWKTLYPEIKHYFNGKVVAHGPFDKSVLTKTCEHYGFNIPANFEYVDTVKLGRQKLPNVVNHKLPTLAQYFKLGGFKHHNALDDTIICAKIYLELIKI